MEWRPQGGSIVREGQVARDNTGNVAALGQSDGTMHYLQMVGEPIGLVERSEHGRNTYIGVPL